MKVNVDDKLTELVAIWLGLTEPTEEESEELEVCLVGEEVEPEEDDGGEQGATGDGTAASKGLRPKNLRELKRRRKRARLEKGMSRQMNNMMGLARKKTAGAVLSQINSLEGDGARGADDAFAGSGVEKPASAQDIMNEEKDALLDELIGAGDYDGADEGNEEEEEEDEEEDEDESLEEVLEQYHEEYHDCMTQLKAFISFFQVRCAALAFRAVRAEGRLHHTAHTS